MSRLGEVSVTFTGSVVVYVWVCQWGVCSHWPIHSVVSEPVANYSPILVLLSLQMTYTIGVLIVVVSL